MVNYEIDITHVCSLHHNYVRVSYFVDVWLLWSTIVCRDSNDSGGMQVHMRRGHLLYGRAPIWREIKVRLRGLSII